MRVAGVRRTPATLVLRRRIEPGWAQPTHRFEPSGPSGVDDLAVIPRDDRARPQAARRSVLAVGLPFGPPTPGDSRSGRRIEPGWAQPTHRFEPSGPSGVDDLAVIPRDDRARAQAARRSILAVGLPFGPPTPGDSRSGRRVEPGWAQPTQRFEPSGPPDVPSQNAPTASRPSTATGRAQVSPGGDMRVAGVPRTPAILLVRS